MTHNSEIDSILGEAVAAYKYGCPVVVLSEENDLLHGEETLKTIKDLGLSLKCRIFKGVPLKYWNDTDWPEILEAARLVFMQGKFPNAS